MDGRQDKFGVFSIAAHEPRLYADRAEGGVRLAEDLARFRAEDPVVLGIPRGGIPVAREVADRLGAELDVIVARKLGAPQQKELAIGAVTADGTRVLNLNIIQRLGVSEEYLDGETAAQRREAVARELKFRSGLPGLNVHGRTVILVDDGLATGATMRACISSLRRQVCKKTIVAVPVGAQETCASIAGEVDELVCPHRPEPFYAVGAHYAAFGQVTDAEVERALREYRERRAARTKSPSPGQVVRPH